VSRLVLHWIIAAIALLVAVNIVPGIRVEGDNAWVPIAVMALVLGLVNAVVRPVLSLLSLPLIFLTLGLFLLVINTAMLALASWITTTVFGAGFVLGGFWPAFLGSIVISLVSFALSLLFKRD
jgi:putative membrane protein